MLNPPLNRKLRMALIGGGGAAFIGRVHALAATLDLRAELVAGALSSDPDKAKQYAPAFGIAPQRAYSSYEELIDKENELPADQRVDFVSIATPNATHFPIAKRAIEAGFNVVCDKPMTTTANHAEQLRTLVLEKGVVFALTHNYSGYPLVRQARQMVQEGQLGRVQAIRAEYIQGWLRGVDPQVVPARGRWKTDPAIAGPSGALGDIGTHAFHLACYISSSRPKELSSTLRALTPERELDDYGHVLVRFEDDALAMITFSQATHGRANDLSIEVDGSQAALTWRQEEPNQMTLREHGRPHQVFERHPAADYTNEMGRQACRLPAGHPEAFLEAFANVYGSAFDDMVARQEGNFDAHAPAIYPTVEDGVCGVRFIDASLASSEQNGNWLTL